jgi:hypothetical protein
MIACNKFYIRDYCAIPCGATAAGHFSQGFILNGEETHKYQLVVDVNNYLL